jgi:hypothetical protein
MYCNIMPERRNSGARGTAVTTERLGKHASATMNTRTQQWKNPVTPPNNGGTVGSDVFYAICAEAL